MPDRDAFVSKDLEYFVFLYFINIGLKKLIFLYK